MVMVDLNNYKSRVVYSCSQFVLAMCSLGIVVLSIQWEKSRTIANLTMSGTPLFVFTTDLVPYLVSDHNSGC